MVINFFLVSFALCARAHFFFSFLLSDTKIEERSTDGDGLHGSPNGHLCDIDERWEANGPATVSAAKSLGLKIKQKFFRRLKHFSGTHERIARAHGDMKANEGKTTISVRPDRTDVQRGASFKPNSSNTFWKRMAENEIPFVCRVECLHRNGNRWCAAGVNDENQPLPHFQLNRVQNDFNSIRRLRLFVY